MTVITQRYKEIVEDLEFSLAQQTPDMPWTVQYMGYHQIEANCRKGRVVLTLGPYAMNRKWVIYNGIHHAKSRVLFKGRGWSRRLVALAVWGWARLQGQLKEKEQT